MGDESHYNDTQLLGLPLDEALKKLGGVFAVEYTKAPRFAPETGRARVVRVKGGVITAALFNDTLTEDSNEHIK